MPAFRPPEKPAGLQARGLNWRKRSKHWVAYWVARADLVYRGYPLESQRLWPASDAVQPTAPVDDEWNYIGSECERLQDEMLAWAHGGEDSDPLSLFNDSLESLIRIYQVDPDSSYHNLRHETRIGYDSRMRIITKAVGKAKLSRLTFRDFKRWHEGFRGDKKDPRTGRTVTQGKMVSRAHTLMTMIRMVIGFGNLAGLPECARLKTILSDPQLEFEVGRARTQYLTAEQVIAIRKKAHAAGRASIALAQAMTYELGWRQKDVLGEWIPVSEPGLSQIINHGKKWVIGIEWREISDDLILRHRLSKSVRGRNAVADPKNGQIEEYDLKEYPMIMEEIARISPEKRKGPLLINERTDIPWRTKVFAKDWRSIARAAGVPDEVQNRDSRAGSATEADMVDDETIDVKEVQNHLGHATPEMTERYIRNRRHRRTKLQRARVKNRMTNDAKTSN